MKTLGAKTVPVMVFNYVGKPVAIRESIMECARWYNVSTRRIRDRIRDGKLDKDLELFFDLEITE